MFKDKLAATSTWREKFTCCINADNSDQFATTTCDEIRDHSALGAERHSITRIFDIATGDNSSIIYKSSNSD